MSITFEDVVGQVVAEAPAASQPPAAAPGDDAALTRNTLRALKRDAWRRARLDDA